MVPDKRKAEAATPALRTTKYFSGDPSVAAPAGRLTRAERGTLKRLVAERRAEIALYGATKERRLLNRLIVEQHRKGTATGRYEANKLIDAYRSRISAEQETWHRNELYGRDPEIAWCFYSNGRNAPGGRYKTTTGHWALIGDPASAPYLPLGVKRGRPVEAFPAGYWNPLPHSIEKLRGLFRQGRRTQEERDIYDELARHVAENPCPRAALARELECDPKAVDRLKGRGMTLLETLDKTNDLLEEVNERLGLVLGLNAAHLEADVILADANSDDIA